MLYAGLDLSRQRLDVHVLDEAGQTDERTKHRLGRQRGAKVARVDIARQLAEAIWHVLTKNEPFAPAGPAIKLVA